MPIQITPNRELLLTAIIRTSERLLTRMCSHVNHIIRRPVKGPIADFAPPDRRFPAAAIIGMEVARDAARGIRASKRGPSVQKNRLGAGSPVALRRYEPGARVGSTRQTLTHVHSFALSAARVGCSGAAACRFPF